MFENYSLADLLANLKKKKKWNAIAVIVLFLLIALPMSYKAITSKSVVKNSTSYSSYLIYKINAPEKEFNIEANNNKNQFSYFYSKLISSNMNGAYLFNDSTDQEVSKIAGEIASNTTQLRNSDTDFWDKKIIVTSLGDYTGVSVKALTTSPALNQLIERKVDALMNSYKDVFKDVTINKLETVNSQEVGGSETTVSNFSLKQLVLRNVVVFILAVFIVVFINFVWYLFNPTMNRVGDFRKYDIHQVFEIENTEVLRQLIRYKKESLGEFAVVTSSKDIAKQWEQKIQDVTIEYVEASNFERICQLDAYLFVEEFGKTRYIDFEKKLQELHNFDKKIIGVAVFPL